MTEPDEQDFKFQHYKPQHPLPEEIRKMTRDDTVCQYCGVSYLIHTEIKMLEDKLKETEEKLEYYKGREDRETLLRMEKEELLEKQKELEQSALSKENTLSKLNQDLTQANETTKSLSLQLKESIACAEKYREHILKMGKDFLASRVAVGQQREILQALQVYVQNFRESTAQQFRTARDAVKDMCTAVKADYDALQSHLQCTQMEQMVTIQSNKTLTERLRDQEEKLMNLKHCQQDMTSLEKQNQHLQRKTEELLGQLEASDKKSVNIHLELEKLQKEFRVKADEMEHLAREKQQQEEKNGNAFKLLNSQLHQKEGELAMAEKQLKSLENKYREIEKREANVAHQSILSSNEVRDIRESLTRAQSDNEALKNERETMIAAHQARIEELRESFKRKMSQAEMWPQKLQTTLVEEKAKHQSEMVALEKKLKENFVMELKIEKEKYDELLQKYHFQTQEQNAQRRVERETLETKHRQEVEIVQQQLRETKREAERRETDFRKETDSLKRIIAELQNKLGKFESQGEEKVGELSAELQTLRSQLDISQEKILMLSTSLHKAEEEIQFLENTVRSECEERSELTEALSEARQQLLALKKNSGSSGQMSSGNSENILAPIKNSTYQRTQSSASSITSSDSNKPSVPTHSVNVSYVNNHARTPRPKDNGTIDDNRRRISALMGRP